MNRVALSFAAAVGIAGLGFAATPVAVWDGANTDLGNFSLTVQNDNTIENNVITIASGATGGVVYTGDNSSLNNCTFIIRCSGLDLANANNQYLLSLHQNMLGGGNGDASYNKVGVSLAANNAAVRGIWGNAFYDDNGDSLQVADPFSAGTDIVVNIQTSGGVFAYEIVTDANTGARTLVKRFGHTGLKASQTNYKGFSLGGIYEKASSTLSPATGWTISKMAVFGSTLSEAEILGYAFPSDIDTIPVNANTTVSALNTLIAASSGSKIILSVADGVEIAVDTAFVASVPVEVASSGTITLSANTQPAASYFSAVSFGGVQGAVKRTWMANPGVVGFNFNANGGRNGQGNTDGAADTSLALEIGTWYKDAYSPSGSSTAMFADGISVLTWQANNVYAEAGDLTAGTFIQGYLDDGGNVNIKLSAVPYETYDVIIYCSTDDSSKSFKAKTVNGTIYTWDSTAGETTTTSSDTATWGLASAAAGKAVYGANTLRINGLSGALSIKGGTNGNNARGCISAIQIMPTGTSTAPEMTVGTAGQTTQANWTDALWNVATAPTSGNVVINVSGDVELTVDETVALSAITVTGTGSLKIIPDQPNNVTFTASSISSSAVPLIFANDGIGIATISAPVTYLYKTTSINSSTYGNTYTTGVGAQGSSVAISHNGGSVTLQGATYYLGESHNDTATTVTFDDATAVYADCGVGMATYSVEGTSSITAQRLILSQGAAGRTAVMTVKDTASINVTGTSDVDSNQASIMFGHWNGPSTFTIQDSATFTAASQVLVGKTANNHTININGGTFTARGVKMAGYASGTNVLNLNGGLLVLGDVGITSYGSTTISVNVLDDSEIRASAATLPISQAVTIAADKVLSFTTNSSVSATVVTLTGAVSGTGGISVGAGVTLNLGTNRPEGEISVDADGTLAVVMASKVDVPVLKVASQPASVVLYDTDGTTELDGATVEYDAVAGTITVKPPVNTWNVASDLSFDTAANWSAGLPQSTQDAAIKVTGDVALTIAGTYEAATLTVSGSGVVEFSGEGSFTVGTLYLNGGATLAPNSKISATNIVLDGGTVLRLEDTTESAAISGAGAVETYGAVTFSGNNTFTGGLTVKTGSTARTETQQGFGKNNYGQAIANLSRIVVENGGSLDLKNTKDACYAITIAGKGIENNGVYSGAIFNSGEAMGSGSRQTASLTLSADAMVKVASGHGWGIVNSGHAASVLSLGGRTLTVSGSGTFPVVNANTASGTATTGTLIMDGVNLQLTSTACNFSGVNVVVKGCTSVDFESAPSALGSLTISPTASGTTASNWNLPTTCVPVVNTANVDPSELSDGQSVVLFTDSNEHLEYNSNIVWQVGGRFEGHNDAHEVTATYATGIPQPFLHYDFNNGAAVDTGMASDSKYQISSIGEGGSVTLVNSRNWKAVQVHTDYTPYWSSSTAGISSFHAGEATVATVARLKETGIILWGLGNNGGSNTALGLVAPTATSAAVIMRNPDGTITTLATVSDTDDLTKGWHLFVVVADANGTTFYVDKQKATSDVPAATAIGQQGQLGSFHGGAPTGYNKAGTTGDGYYLDDWRIYDAALTVAELRALKRKLLPDAFFLHLR